MVKPKYNKDFEFQEAKAAGANFIYQVRVGNHSDYYETLEEARKDFPSIDPNGNGKDFTWGMFGGIDELSGRPVMMFVDWETDNALSR